MRQLQKHGCFINYAIAGNGFCFVTSKINYSKMCLTKNLYLLDYHNREMSQGPKMTSAIVS
jgi:hypothetical protein